MKRKKLPIRNIVFLVLLIIFVWYIYKNTGQIQDLYRFVRKGEWPFLILALLAQFGFYFFIILLTKQAFKTVGMKRKIIDLFPLIFGSLFVNTLAPTAGQSGTILFADDAAKRQESTPTAVIASVIATMIAYVAFSFILIFSIFYLRRLHLLNDYEIFASLVFAAVTILPGFLIVLAHRNRNGAEKLLFWFRKLVNRILKKFNKETKPSAAWAKTVTQELVDASESVYDNKKEIFYGLVLGVLAHGFSILSLWIIFLAFDLNIHYGALIAGYAFAEVARIISPQPEGVGVVEVVMAVLFTTFGVPPVQATAIALVFRGINFWIPLAVGFALIKKTRSFSGEKT